MWIGHSCWINFCHFFDIVNLVIFHPDYIDSGRAREIDKCQSVRQYSK